MAAALYPRELASWSLTAVAMAALEGGLLGVIVKTQFAGTASPAILNFMVAIVAGAPAIAHLSSPVFSAIAMGRDKLLVLSRLMQVIALCLLVMVLPDQSISGLLAFVLLALLARMAWSGIVTVRAAVWRANYQRQWRGRITAKFVRIGALLLAIVSALIGWMMDWQEDAYRLFFPTSAVSILAGSLIYRRSRVRRHSQLLKAEKAVSQQTASRLDLPALLDVLRSNRQFRQYMIGMMFLGGGNMMVVPLLVVLMNEHFHLSRFHQVVVTSSLSLLTLYLVMPVWAKYLDRKHIIDFRAVHSWNFVACATVFAAAAILNIPWMLWLGAVLAGSTYAGGQLGWNLGHHDFSDDANSTHYMAVHVALTGVRGLLAPLLAIAVYQLLGNMDAAYAPYAMLLPLAMGLAGSGYLVYLSRQRHRA